MFLVFSPLVSFFSFLADEGLSGLFLTVASTLDFHLFTPKGGPWLVSLFLLFLPLLFFHLSTPSWSSLGD